MIKPLTLGIALATFITSLAFTFAGFTNNLQPNIITGNAIGATQLASYAVIPLAISAITIGVILISMRRPQD
tara:strand:+ start:29 stop:244 length:216 start_codon:yes stop_codon:yes gene_type:complete